MSETKRAHLPEVQRKSRARVSACSPQGGESGGGIGMRLARQPHRPDSQISLPVGLWEGGHIITSPGMSRGLMRWMTGGWITSNRRFQLPFLFRWWWLSWQYFQAAVKNSNSVRCLCVHPSWGSCISTGNTAQPHSHACSHFHTTLLSFGMR